MIELRRRSVDTFSRGIYVDDVYVGIVLFSDKKNGPRIEWENRPNAVTETLIWHAIINIAVPVRTT